MIDIKELENKQKEMIQIFQVMLDASEEVKALTRLEVRTKADLDRLNVLLELARKSGAAMGTIF